MEMEIKRAINWLRKEKNLRENHEPTDYILLAMQALEKQVPQKPSIEDEMGYFICPNCNAAINYTSDREDHKFCLNCGQKLDWN